MKRRIGKFKVSKTSIDKTLDQIEIIFSFLKMVPVKCEYIYENNSFEYTALCERFDEVDEGCIPKFYNIEIEKDAKGFIEAIRVR